MFVSLSVCVLASSAISQSLSPFAVSLCAGVEQEGALCWMRRNRRQHRTGQNRIDLGLWTFLLAWPNQMGARQGGKTAHGWLICRPRPPLGCGPHWLAGGKGLESEFGVKISASSEALFLVFFFLFFFSYFFSSVFKTHADRPLFTAAFFSRWGQ